MKENVHFGWNLFWMQTSLANSFTFSSVFSAGLGGCGWGTLKPKSSSIFSAAFRLATFLLGPIPSAVCPATDTWERQRKIGQTTFPGTFLIQKKIASCTRKWCQEEHAVITKCSQSGTLVEYLHDKLSASGQSSLGHQCILRLFFLLGLLDLS